MATNGSQNIATAATGTVLQGAGVGTTPVFSAATYPSTAAGTGTLLRADGTNWVATTATYPTTTTINQILYSSSGSVISGLATANNGVLTTGTSGIPVITALATNGQVIIGSGSGAPAAATLTAGTGVSITNAANAITINSVGSGLTWTVVTGATQAMLVNNGYIANRASNIAFSLPTTSAVGDVVAVFGMNTALGWTIGYTTNQQIFIGISTTTLTTGSLSSTNIRDSVTLVCTTANLTWTAVSIVGNITVV